MVSGYRTKINLRILLESTGEVHACTVEFTENATVGVESPSRKCGTGEELFLGRASGQGSLPGVEINFGKTIGDALKRGDYELPETSVARIILRKSEATPEGFIVQTTFPVYPR